MRSVNVNFLRSGQVVAEPVTNGSGAVLCPMGYTLTEKSIERLKNARVSTVMIEGSAADGPDIGKLEATLNKRFKGIDDPILLRLKALKQDRLDRLRAEFGG